MSHLTAAGCTLHLSIHHTLHICALPRAIGLLLAAGVVAAAAAAAAAGGGRAFLPRGIGAVSEVGQDPDRGGKVNQDAFFAAELPGALCAGIMDGHGKKGQTVTAHLRETLPECVGRALQARAADFEGALRDAFVEAHGGALAAEGVDARLSGTTCIVALLAGTALYVAYVGDSHAVLGRRTAGGWEAVALAETQTTRRPEERSRIEAAGGRIDGSGNVWAGPFGVAMTRALGDGVLKSAGLICEPEVRVRELEPEDRFVVLMTDGISDVLRDDRVVELAAQHLAAEAGSGTEPAAAAAAALVAEARERWQAGPTIERARSPIGGFHSFCSSMCCVHRPFGSQGLGRPSTLNLIGSCRN